MNEKNRINDRLTGRIGYIDGMRGIASVLVILCHLSCVFIPSLYFFEKAGTDFEKLWLATPLNVLTNGNAAVQCFFVLSGYLITRKIYSGSTIKRNPLSEYYKLIRVVAPGILLAALLMVTRLMFHLEAAESNSILSFVNDYNNFPPTIKSVISDIFYRSFFEGSVYVGPFWTIRFEFLGSILIGALAYYAHTSNYSKLFYLVVGFALIFISIRIVSFILGAFAYDCIGKEEEDNSIIGRIIRKVIKFRVLIYILFILGLYLFSVNMTVSGAWSPIKYLPLIRDYPELIRSIGIFFIIIAINKSTVLQRLLSIRLLVWLGRISAYTYAFHWPIILSVGSGVYLLLSNIFDYYIVVLIASICVFMITFVLAHFYTKTLPRITALEKKLTQRINKVIQNKLKKKHTSYGE